MTASLADVLPAAAVALGVDHPTPGDGVRLPRARAVVVLLVDGMGERQIAAVPGHAPFLRSLARAVPEPAERTVLSGFPSTTATSLGMFGTGLPPGGHGLLGTEVLDPDRDVVFSQLGWDPAVDPHRWQPAPTVFERVDAAGLDVVRIGPRYFDGSGLTEAVLRGGRFVVAEELDARVDAAVAAVRSGARGLVYVYWGELDKVGHVHGVDSWQWTQELENVDAATKRLAERLPKDALLVVTSDHGMIDVPFEDRVDVAHDDELAAGVRFLGGEPRATYLYCEPGAAADVLAVWSARLAGRADVLLRDDAVRLGWFGAVAPHVLPRIGDVVVAATSSLAVVDSRTMRKELLGLKGLHGARLPEEQEVPLLVTPGRA